MCACEDGVTCRACRSGEARYTGSTAREDELQARREQEAVNRESEVRDAAGR